MALQHVQPGERLFAYQGMREDFGTLIDRIRRRSRVEIREIAALFPEFRLKWDRFTYTHTVGERKRTPGVGELFPFYQALVVAGVHFLPEERNQFVALAREAIESKRGSHPHPTQQEWDALLKQLAEFDQLPLTSADPSRVAAPEMVYVSRAPLPYQYPALPQQGLPPTTIVPTSFDEEDFGDFLRRKRTLARIRISSELIPLLPGWTRYTWERLEGSGGRKRVPRFEELALIFSALVQAGVPFTPVETRRFLALARRKLEKQSANRDYPLTEVEWGLLEQQLVSHYEGDELDAHDGLLAPLLDTSHVLGRDAWLESILQLMRTEPRKKFIVVQGQPGIGKSSALHLLFRHLAEDTGLLPLYFPGPSNAGMTAEDYLVQVLATILLALTVHPGDIQVLSPAQRIDLILHHLTFAGKRVVLLVDQAEIVLRQDGRSLSECWQQFLTAFVQRQHGSSLVLSTRAWPVWVGSDHSYIAETYLQALSPETASSIWRRLGFINASEELLQLACRRCGGNPRLIELRAATLKHRFASSWESGESADILAANEEDRLLHTFLEESRIFDDTDVEVLALLQQVISIRLSQDAESLLEVLSVAEIPLAFPLLNMILPRAAYAWKELQRSSLVDVDAMTYLKRAHLPAIVKEAGVQRLSSKGQLCAVERQVITLYRAWLNSGMLQKEEAGTVVTALAVLLLKYHQLLEAAQLLLRYATFSFRLGHATRVARTAEKEMANFDWRSSLENTCGGLLLYHFLSPFLGKSIERKRASDYQFIRKTLLSGQIALQASVEVHLAHVQMLHAMNAGQYEEALAILDTSYERLEAQQESNVDLKASLLEKRGWLFSRWSESSEEQSRACEAQALREQAIALYEECSVLLLSAEEPSPLKGFFLKKRLARVLNYLGYHLSRTGRNAQSLAALEQSRALQEQGYAEVDSLAPLYGDTSQTLASLGRFREALCFDALAYTEAQRLADAGYTFSREEIWIYRINRGCLYVLLGRVGEAEPLLREALEHIHPRRSYYRMFADNALKQIARWREQAEQTRPYQLDWRWVERYRLLASFDSYWWLAPSGPFSGDEQEQWDLLFPPASEDAKEQLKALITQSREREFAAALDEQRLPRLHYPAIEIEEVHQRIAGLLDLQQEIDRDEPNAIVRRLYHETIEEEVWFLQLIEATSAADSKRFRELNLLLNSLPTPEEMHYALGRIRRIVLQGMLLADMEDAASLERREAFRQASHQVIQFLRETLHLPFDLSPTEGEMEELRAEALLPSSQPRRMVDAQTAQRFLEDVLRRSDFAGWQVVIDAHASVPHVEQGLRHLYLPSSQISLLQLKDYLEHELAVHVARCVAGERSILGLLGIHTKNSLETEEGLATYFAIQQAERSGQVHDETAEWFGTVATGLATGVSTAPLDFLSLCTFFERFVYLLRLLKRPDQDIATARKFARKHALARALRTYRGVPDLRQAGLCYSKDAHYLRGLRKIERVVRERGEIVLDELAVGVVALEELPALEELGVSASPQVLRTLIQDPELDAYILSFEEPVNAPI